MTRTDALTALLTDCGGRRVLLDPGTHSPFRWNAYVNGDALPGYFP